MDLPTAIILLLTGLAVFLVGMRLMSNGLKALAGKRIKNFFKKTQNNAFAGAGIGVAVTAVIQSSDATAAMVLGFINAGAMTLFQGVSIILGAYIGTTVTGVLASFSSLSISLYLIAFSFVGVVLTFFKKEWLKNLGDLLIGFGFLFFGLRVMSEQFTAINNQTGCFNQLFASISFGPLLLLLGILITALLQSSSAMTGIVIAMVTAQAMPFESGLYVIIGATIGTITNTFLASIGGSVDAKRATWTVFSMRVVMGLIAMGVLMLAQKPIGNAFLTVFKTPGLAAAMFLVIYNIITIPLLIPLIKPVTNLFARVIKDKEQDKLAKVVKFVDDKLLNTPSIALLQTKREIIHMLDLSKQNLINSYDRVKTQNAAKDAEIEDIEGQIDYLNNRISKFLIALSPKVNDEEAKSVGAYFHVINDIERIGDHAYNYFDMSKRMEADGIKFSEIAIKELDEMNLVIMRMFDIARNIFDEQKIEGIEKLHGLEDVSDKMKTDMCSNHYERITKNLCSAELTPFYTDLISEFERIGDHLTNVGYSVINPTGDDEFDEKVK